MSDQPTQPTLTISKINEVLQRIAYKIAGDEFDLTHEDFRIQFFPWRRHAWRMRRMGSAVGIYFGVFPLDKEFLFYLREALRATQRTLNGKPAIELASRLRAMHEEAKDVNWQSLPRLVPKEEIEVEELYRVIVKHKSTGLVVVKEMKQPSFSRMVLDARIDLAETLDMIGHVEKRKLP